MHVKEYILLKVYILRKENQTLLVRNTQDLIMYDCMKEWQE